MDQVDIAVHNTVHESDMPTKEIAQRLGISYQILLNKANANNETHKLTLKESIALQLVTNTTSIHDAVGLELSAHNSNNQKDPISLMSAMLKAGKEQGDISKAIIESLEDGRFTAREKQHCIEQTAEAIQALQVLQESLSSIPTNSKIQAV